MGGCGEGGATLEHPTVSLDGAQGSMPLVCGGEGEPGERRCTGASGAR
jgi:hypothetical protein